MPEVWTPVFVATTNTTISSADANAGYRGNLNYFRQFLTNPSLAGLPLVSDSADGASFRTLPDGGMTNQKVNGATSVVATFAALTAANKNGFHEVGGDTAGPVSAQNYYVYNIVDANFPTTYGCQIAVQIDNVDEVYIRLIVTGTPTGWRKILTTANIATLALSAGSLIAGSSVTINALPASAPGGGVLVVVEAAASGGSWLLESINNTFVIARAGAATYFTLAANGAISAIAATITNAISAGSASISGALAAGSISTTGTGSVSAGGNVTAALSMSAVQNISAGGSVVGSQLQSTVATGTVPLTVASTSQVANLNASFLEGHNTAYFASLITSGTPLGMICAFETLAELTAAGAAWARYTAADGRLLVGAGTTFSQTFAQATDYGTSWAHLHAAGTLTWGGGFTGTAADTFNAAPGANSVSAGTHQNSIPSAQAVGGSSASTTVLIPSRGVIWGRRV